jgi:hypothetical protein
VAVSAPDATSSSSSSAASAGRDALAARIAAAKAYKQSGAAGSSPSSSSSSSSEANLSEEQQEAMRQQYMQQLRQQQASMASQSSEYSSYIQQTTQQQQQQQQQQPGAGNALDRLQQEDRAPGERPAPARADFYTNPEVPSVQQLMSTAPKKAGTGSADEAADWLKGVLQERPGGRSCLYQPTCFYSWLHCSIVSSISLFLVGSFRPPASRVSAAALSVPLHGQRVLHRLRRCLSILM